MRLRLASTKRALLTSAPVRLLRRAAGWFPLTWRSALTVGLLLWARQAYGVERSDLVLLVLGTGGLALVAAATVAVLVAALAIRLTRAPQPEEPWVLTVGAPWRTGYGVGALGWLPLVRLELDWEHPPEARVWLEPRRGRLMEEVTPARRGAHTSLVRRWTVSDAFGLASVSFARPVAQPVKILPTPGRLRPRELLQQLSSGDLVSHPGGEPEGDYIEMRRYAPGDPIKHVLWKAYARSRKLLVRTPERAIAPRQKTLVYMVAGPGDEPTAGTVRAALEQGIFGSDFLFGADGSQAPTRQVDEALEMIIRSAGEDARGGLGLGDFLALGRAEGAQACVVFTPGRPGPWLERVEAEVARNPRALSLVMAVEDLQQPEARPLWRRLLVADDQAAHQGVKALREVWDRFVKLGARVTVIDRSSGHAVLPGQLKVIDRRRR